MRLGLTVTALATLAAATAQAGVTVVYRGTITAGEDLGGLFGRPAATLDGSKFELGYSFDDSVDDDGRVLDPPFASRFVTGYAGNYSGGWWLSVDGIRQDLPCSGRYYCFTSHGVSSGKDGVWSVDGDLEAFDDDVGSHGSGIFAVLYDEAFRIGITSTVNPFVVDYDYRQPLIYTVQAGDQSFGHVRISELVIPDRAPPFYRQFVDADLHPLSVRVSSTYVPEPATWALMILGFGAAGTALRRRRAACGADSKTQRALREIKNVGGRPAHGGGEQEGSA